MGVSFFTLINQLRKIMPKDKILLSVACMLLVIAVTIICLKLNEKDKSRLSHNKSSDLQIVENSRHRERDVTNSSMFSRASREQSSAYSTNLDFRRRWHALADVLTGNKLMDARIALINEAEKNLSSIELVEFLEEIVESGEFSNYFITISSSVLSVFSNNRDIDDLLAVTDIVNRFSDFEAKKLFFNVISRNISIDFFHQLVNNISDPLSKQSFLTGFCASMITRRLGSPVEAFSLYQSELPVSGDFSGLIMVAGSLGNDFEKVIEFMHNNGHTIAEDVRAAIIRRWTSINHEAAISYIIENPEYVDPQHLSTAIKTWAGTNRAGPTAWARSLPSGNHKDIAINALAEIYYKSNPARSWQLVMDEVSDTAKDSSLLKVYEEWIKIDYEAAETARIAFETATQSRLVTQ